MLSLFLIIADIASGVKLLWILYISLAKLILYIKAKEDQLAFFLTSTLDISQGSSKQTSCIHRENPRKNGTVWTAPNANYDRTQTEQYLINGFRFNFIGEITSFESPLLKSARQSPDILSKEHDTGKIGRIAGSGPFHTATLLTIADDCSSVRQMGLRS